MKRTTKELRAEAANADDAGYSVFGDTLRECADGIDRLTTENEKIRAAIYEAAGWQATSIAEYKAEFGDDADPLDDAITEIRYDRKRWAEACETIRAGKDWPQNHYPSMNDRWTVAAQKMELDRLTAELARERERVNAAKDEICRTHGLIVVGWFPTKEDKPLYDRVSERLVAAMNILNDQHEPSQPQGANP